jgi:Na+/H+ antiporter NhaC
MGWVSLIPVVLAIGLAIATRNTVVSLSIACIVGCLIKGDGIFGFTDLIVRALGDPSSIWTILMVVLFSVLVTYFERSGAIDGFTRIAQRHSLKRRGVQLISWALGLFCFADSMSPLFVGSVMKKLSDKAKISREKLAYIADSTASPLSVIHPFSSWIPYLAGLAFATEVFASEKDAYGFALKAIGFNFYAILSVLLVFLIAMGIVRDFGPMRKAEKRAMEEGKVLADGAVPLTTESVAEKNLFEKPRILINFVLPVVVLIIICGITVVLNGEPAICEAAMILVVAMSVSFMVQGLSLKDLNKVFLSGVRNSVPAVLVLCVAYPLNTLSSEMGTADFLVGITGSVLPPALLPFLIFVLAAILSFATGTSWGTYAICVPLFLPLAFRINNGQFNAYLLACFGAIAGGGVFGDHCSPLSDTTILSSMGAGSDHIDHLNTQLPYALVCAALTAVLYMIIGLVTV